ncbi:heterokaryon incompatibility protein-domain-containing protein [Fusarium avenaceum]|nr:heterokaryon incompatibility protein-domain-containing protein [Fusarium avenaceum]
MALMRCMNTGTFELCTSTQIDFKEQGYAILSHRWGSEEILFAQIGQFAHDLRNTKGRHARPQLDKILQACHTAREQGLQWIWIDNCCINKSDNSELSESINSMFKWYREAVVCLTYLSDVRKCSGSEVDSHVFKSFETGEMTKWFTRGWTLQELLAPGKLLFYDTDWSYLGSKQELAGSIEEVTGIATQYLTGETDFRIACIAAKMSWAADRETTKEEDMAYSLFGIFNLHLPVQYGEGKAAFLRLQDALIAKNDESLFAWKMPLEGPGSSYQIVPDNMVDLGPDEWGLLAPSVKWYKHCGKMTIQHKKTVMRQRGGFTRTPQGISGPISKRNHYVTAVLTGLTVVGAIPFQIWLAVRNRTTLKYTLNCWEPNEAGAMRAVRLHLRPVRRDPPMWIRTASQSYDLTKSAADTGYSAVGTVWQPQLY